MAPRANWNKLLDGFDFESWVLEGGRKEIAVKEFPFLYGFFTDPKKEVLPSELIQELVDFTGVNIDPTSSSKLRALQGHLGSSDAANSHRLACELLVVSKNEDPLISFLGDFVRDLLTKPKV
jgi:hypothetical protein